jgi:hypothetical protein
MKIERSFKVLLRIIKVQQRYAVEMSSGSAGKAFRDSVRIKVAGFLFDEGIPKKDKVSFFYPAPSLICCVVFAKNYFR